MLNKVGIIGEGNYFKETNGVDLARFDKVFNYGYKINNPIKVFIVHE